MQRKRLRGMTLIEMLVAIAVMLIAMEGFTLLFVKSWETNKFILEEGLASAAASRATNKIITQLRSVRQADNGDFAVESGADFDVKVYADIDDDGVTERVHYFLDLATDELKVGVTDPLGTTPITVEDARLIRVHLLVNIDPIRAPNNINIESFADLRNLKNL